MHWLSGASLLKSNALLGGQLKSQSGIVEGPQQGASRIKDGLLIGLILAGGTLIRVIAAAPLVPNGLFDDAYTGLRIARNFAQGLGFVFNPGERVLGTTAPLFVAILSGLGRIFGVGHLEGIAVAAGIVSTLGLLFLCDKILSLAGLPAEVKWTYLAVLAFLPSFVANATSGMETSFVLFLMALSLYLSVKNHLMALAVLGVILVLSRADTGIWLLALGIHILLTRGTRSMRALVLPLSVFLGGVFFWLLFSKLYFGRALPQSLAGKAASHGAFARPDLSYTLTFLSAFVPAQRFGMWGFGIIGVALGALLISTIAFWRQYPHLRPVVYFFPLYVAIFWGCRTPLFSWYSIPPKWAFYLLATYLVWWAMQKLTGVWRVPVKPQLAMAVVTACVFVQGIRAVAVSYRSHPTNTPLAISDLIERGVKPDGRIFLEHIGLIGYRTGRYLYDYGGLVSPETVRLRRQYGANWVGKAAHEYQADVVVLYDYDLPAVERKDSDDALWFQNAYRHVEDYQLGGVETSVFFLKGSPRILSGPQ
jgi:hypothetical protein